MKWYIKRVATLLVAILSLNLLAYAGTNNLGDGGQSGFDFEINESETVYIINLTNTLENDFTFEDEVPATPSDATPSDATPDKPEKPIKPSKPISGGYSGYEQEKPTEDKITIIPANIETSSEHKIGIITAEYEHKYSTTKTAIDADGKIEPYHPKDENRTLPKTGDVLDSLHLLLLLSITPFFIKKLLPFFKSLL